jgi:hypothetical protein
MEGAENFVLRLLRRSSAVQHLEQTINVMDNAACIYLYFSEEASSRVPTLAEIYICLLRQLLQQRKTNDILTTFSRYTRITSTTTARPN